MNLALTTPDGRPFRLVELRPYTRADGSETTLAVWTGACAVCGRPYEVTTPSALPVLAKSKSFGIRHCAEHRLTPAQALARARNVRKHGRRE